MIECKIIKMPKMNRCLGYGYTPDDQLDKVAEEYHELQDAMLSQVMPDRAHIAEEAFDLIQATLTLLEKLGINIEEANERHIYKMASREAKPWR